MKSNNNMNLNRFLQITRVKQSEFLLFGYKVFSYFKTSNHKNLLLLGIPRVANLLLVFLYIFKFGFLNLRKKRYFVRLAQYLVGTFSIDEKQNSIQIYSLTINPKWRERGIATYVLKYIETQAINTNRSYLELSVHKTNTLALKFYYNFGFTKIKENRWFFILRKSIKK